MPSTAENRTAEGLQIARQQPPKYLAALRIEALRVKKRDGELAQTPNGLAVHD